MPGAVLVVEVETLFWILLSEPERFALGDVDSVQPGVSWGVVCELEDYVNFFEGTKCRLGVEEVDQWEDGEVCRGEDDPGSVGDALECDGCDEDDAMWRLANVTEGYELLRKPTQS